MCGARQRCIAVLGRQWIWTARLRQYDQRRELTGRIHPQRRRRTGAIAAIASVPLTLRAVAGLQSELEFKMLDRC